MNLYAFVGNNPVNWVDPWGLEIIVYDPALRMLTVKDDSGAKLQQWSGISGPHRRGTLPAGRYILPRGPAVVGANQRRRQSYCDAAGNCWWQPITPTFPTNRSGLGIHPDGNVPGTEGCIGVTENNTSDLFDWLNQNHQNVDEVIVKGR